MKYYYILTDIRQSNEVYSITTFEASDTPIIEPEFMGKHFGMTFDEDAGWYEKDAGESASNGCQIKEITAQEYMLLYKLRYGHEPADAKLEAMAAKADEYLSGDKLTTVKDIQRIIDHPNQLQFIDYVDGIQPAEKFEYTFTCQDFLEQIS